MAPVLGLFPEPSVEKKGEKTPGLEHGRFTLQYT